jgi:hypothetical protein
LPGYGELDPGVVDREPLVDRAGRVHEHVEAVVLPAELTGKCPD